MTRLSWSGESRIEVSKVSEYGAARSEEIQEDSQLLCEDS